MCNLAVRFRGDDEAMYLPLAHDRVEKVEDAMRRPPWFLARSHPFVALDFWAESPVWVNPVKVASMMVVRCDAYRKT